MSGEKNLIPFSERSKEEAREYGRIGGINSGESRRRKKTLRQAIDLAMSLPVSDPKRQEKMAEMGISQEDADNQMAVVVGLMLKAMNGNSKAAEVLFAQMDDENVSTNGQAESHSALIDAIRERNK